MSNHLKRETSPYLLQHAQNPVDWYPWDNKAFQKAKEEDRPIFLSIGYSTCHWCHVMAHESFEDKQTAKFLNNNFVSVKVDREERPDIDSVYMSVCQAFTGSGGWPMSIFMTWDKKPFFAGTYFPPEPQYGMPSFNELLATVVKQWQSNRQELLQSAGRIMAHIKNSQNHYVSITKHNLEKEATKAFADSFDSKNGGFGVAPKFPSAHNILFLLLYSKQNNDKDALHMALKTLLQMRKGGIFDQIGYGFSRYSTDKYFLVPHFEKMLYDNAMLIMAYLAAYCITDDELYLDTAQKTAKYVLREMISQDCGFYSAQDADSEGVEGKYYTFTLKEIEELLGEKKGKEFAQIFDITDIGNFDGTNIPNLLKNDNDKIQELFGKEIDDIYNYRKNRTKLHLDDKHLTSWNSIMIAAMSMLYRVSRKKEYLDVAKGAQVFIEKNLCEGKQIYTSTRNGKHSEKGFLNDYAFYITALIELYNSTLDEMYLKKAEEFLLETVRRFADSENNGYCFSEIGSSGLFINPKEIYDQAIPSGNSVMAYNFVRLYQLTQKDIYKEYAKRQFEFMIAKIQDYPSGCSMFLIAKMLYTNPPMHITVVLKDNVYNKRNEELQEIMEKLPFLANIEVVPESREYPLLSDITTYYICKNHTCQPPTNKLVI